MQSMFVHADILCKSDHRLSVEFKYVDCNGYPQTFCCSLTMFVLNLFGLLKNYESIYAQIKRQTGATIKYPGIVQNHWTTNYKTVYIFAKHTDGVQPKNLTLSQFKEVWWCTDAVFGEMLLNYSLISLNCFLSDSELSIWPLLCLRIFLPIL